MEVLPALLALAWVVAHRCEGTLGMECPEDQYLLVSAEGSKCCPRCSKQVQEDSPCSGIKDPDCKCTRGYKCIDTECLNCLRVPRCSKGEALTKSGHIHYKYECQACSPGEYSNTENGFCRKWTDCSSQALETLQPGNQTHDAVCGIVQAIAAAPGPVESPGSYTTILALLTAVAIFILILGTIFLHLYIWRMKNEKLLIVEGSACTVEHELIRPLEDSWSCQLPEEEHGK